MKRDQFRNFHLHRLLTSCRKPDSLNIHWKTLFRVHRASVWYHSVALDRIAISFLWCAWADCTSRPVNSVYCALNWHADSWSMAPYYGHLLLNTPDWEEENWPSISLLYMWIWKIFVSLTHPCDFAQMSLSFHPKPAEPFHPWRKTEEWEVYCQNKGNELLLGIYIECGNIVGVSIQLFDEFEHFCTEHRYKL